MLKLNAAAGASIGKGDAGYYDALVSRGIDFTVFAGSGSTPVQLVKVNFVSGKAVYSNGRTAVTVPITALDPQSGMAALKVDGFMFLAGGLFYPVTGGGTTAGDVNVLRNVSATDKNLNLVPINGATAVGLLGSGSASLIGMDGATLIGNDAGSLIGMDGGSLIGMDGATLIGMDGASLISDKSGGLIGMDGASLIGMDGASIASANAPGFFSDQGGG